MPRLDQLLARNLGRSRRQVTALLRRGAVETLDGEIWREGKMAVELGQLPLELMVEGQRLHLREHVHLMQHKPLGVVTSRADPRHETAWSLLVDAPMHAELKAVGRLDLDANGLLLWTTDTARIHALTHPKRRVPRSYHVALARAWHPPPRDAQGRIALQLADGSRPRIVALGALEDAERHPALVEPPGTQRVASITLLDGAYHEVKRCFAALGSHVLRLCRVRHAGLELPPGLAPGAWQLLDALPRPDPEPLP